jgi:hypothetical protein
MLYSSVAIVALSVTSTFAPFSHIFHMHPSVRTQNITVALRNHQAVFQEVTINGHDYTMWAGQGLRISAPAGTAVYAASSHGSIHRGDKIVDIEPALDNTQIVLK